ncbi:uncharacterized protein LOC117579468 [Drosophila guanche]|uniref:F-box domain-containing protein n=1 Tax=Drosophila guanche TaxID=7266 RepID=A0A3B0K0W7_DROGU|nr:uncharacterized protein LOC117579468 [Drosophila guanche]SPP77018.1 Hypothetical predicted protein [Drosophila guanche]
MAGCNNILDLPVEAISLIFSYVEELNDRLRLAQAHPKLAKGFSHYAANAHCNVDCDELPISYWSKILYDAGASVVSISLRKKCHVVALLKLAADHCPNLEELNIQIQCEYWGVIAPLLSSLKTLSRISLQNNFVGVDFIDTLHELPLLRSLLLFGFPNKNLRRIHELYWLTTLRIINRKAIDVCLWFAPLKNLINMEILIAYVGCPDIPHCKNLWPKMELLNITYATFPSEKCQNRRGLPYLPSLKQLNIEETIPLMKLSQVFGSSVSKYANTLCRIRFLYEGQALDADDANTISKLKALTHACLPGVSNKFIGLIKSDSLQELFVRHSDNLTNSGILRVLSGCKNLRVIDFYGCKFINKKMVEPALMILKKNGVEADKPVEMRVNYEFGTHISFYDPTLLVIRQSTADGHLI